MIAMCKVYVTEWGKVYHTSLPEDLQQRLSAAIFTKSGAPDRRSKRSVEAWKDLTEWMMRRP